MNTEDLENDALNNVENSENEVKTEVENQEITEKNWEVEYHTLNDSYLRLYAEFDNFRKRTQKEKMDWIKTAGADTAKAVLPVLDDMERAIQNFDNSDITTLQQGVTAIHTKLKNALADKGVIEFVPKGEVFNADIHEALTQIPAPSDDQKGLILDVVEKGYKIHDTVIRYPKVIVTI